MKLADFKKKKAQQLKISMLTCYDYPSACTAELSDLDCVLVGDSVAMVVHGHNSTVMATMEMMVLHTAAVARGISTKFLISDLPFLCHRVSQADTMQNARRLVQAGAHALKIEGADIDTCKTIEYLIDSGIPIMGHIGLRPQSVLQLGGYKVQGTCEAAALELITEAKALECAGCFALVIECVPQTLAADISGSLKIPVIGIGSGVQTDGQVLVWHDMLGLQDEFKPRFVKQFCQGKELMLGAIDAYVVQVADMSFPAPEHAF